MLRVRRANSDGSALLAAPAIVVIGAMVLGTGYMFATFTYATARMMPTFSTAAANVIDPLGGSCLSSKAVSTWDASDGVPLQPLRGGDDVYTDRFLPRGLDTATVTGSGASVWATTDGSSNRAISVDAGEYAWPELADEERVVIAAGARRRGRSDPYRGGLPCCGRSRGRTAGPHR
ncbi:hypothetical protein [Arenivirga flava]|uniref:Uncharacterized protein n=1 Tax=Arenivirga flava TaxID=1930060 RepID=A0AA37UJB5_9MICO|nr:hypothetical protein [Arenivirga flava]GMA28010.1 hypothetical protein GCM10025874_12630 [Arenivirga flava]